MDPAGPWYPTYSRMPAGTAAGTFQTGGGTSGGDFVPHHLGTTTVSQGVPPTTASQLLLQAHTSSSLAGQPPSFNPGGFLSPSPVGYDVFSPLFHHSNSKQAHYVVPHRQPVTQTQTSSAASKQSTTSSESEVSSIRENYNATHQPTFFEHQSHTSATNSTTIPWNHQSNSQLPSPFGILPHESVVSSSPGPPAPPSLPPPSSKSSVNSAYENNFNTHFSSGQSLNNINSSLPQSSMTTDFKSTSYSDEKKVTRAVSPSTIKSAVPTTSVGNAQTFFQPVPTQFGPDSLTNNYSGGNGNATSKVQGSLVHQQSCIVATPNNNASKDYRVPQSPVIRSSAPTTIFPNSTGRSALTQSQDKNSIVPNFSSPNVKTPQSNTQQIVQTKAQTKIYPELGNHEHQRTESGHENSQSSPISYSIMDARTLNYPSNTANNCNNNASGKLANNQRTPPNTNLQQAQQQFHVMNSQQQAPSQQTQQQTTPYRHYTNAPSESEYLHSGRSKSVASTDSAYSSNTSTQNGPDCGVVVPRRPSPLQAHSQASPLGHVPSPAYPMYNSPMATMSSPSPLQHAENNGGNTSQCSNAQTYKAVVQQQVTPPSPLDVSVPRPASQGQVAYSSVITRALGTAESNKTNYNTENQSYDRQQDFGQRQKQQQQQICWDNDNRQSVGSDGRKFPVGYTSNNPDINSQTIPNQQQHSHRGLNVGDRQQGYFDSSQVALQDLSSCRGDPMNAMKNLQPSSSCHIQQQQPGSVGVPTQNNVQKQLDDRQRKIDPNKRRRSFEKTVGNSTSLNDISSPPMMTEYFNRIPPPAHHNSNQQTQNGYFEFDRWNLNAPPTTKMFSGSSGAFGSQNTLHHTNNFVGNSVHQHQSLMVPHHHTPPSIPYFPPFHLPPGHHPTEFQSPADMAPIGYGENSMPIQNSGYQDYSGDQPKVIVPNIEEELGFLQQNQLPVNNNNTNHINRDMKPSCREPNSGFMTSYLKFLQGEREPSPPPAMRGGRKATWNRLKPYPSAEVNKSNDVSSNGGNIKGPNMVKETPTIDYANDPRYFPLPKERKKPYIDSSDDGITSDDDFPFSTRKHEKKQQNNFTPAPTVENIVAKPEIKPKKGRPIKPGGPTDRKRKAAAAAAAAAAADLAAGRTPQKPESNPVILPPRRETSKRKAKEKVPPKQFVDNSDDEEQVDSDSDPAWTPAAKLTGDEEEKKKKRGRPVISKRTKKMLDDDEYSSNEVVSKRGRKKSDSKNATSKFACRIDEKLLASVSDEDIDISPFKRCIEETDSGSGEFVVIKSELDEEYPALWRIDGKTLLQKYEPFNSNGKKLYRNISTYSGWTPQNRHLYQQVPVRFWQQGKLETIVEFLRDEMIIDDRECITKSIKDNEKYQDSFEVYIQTLISQALDSNFLTEIFQEQDEYFLSNVKTIDEVTEERKQRLLSTTKWQPSVVTAISTWPCLNVLKDLPNSESKGKQCVGCNRNKIYARVLLYGQPYNATTLEGSPPDPSVLHDKDFLLCRVCQTKVALFNKVAHQKYLMFLECARRVAGKRLADQNKDTTIILNELLADEAWLNQLFKEVRNIWAEIDSIEHQAKLKENAKNIIAVDEKNDINSIVPNVPSNIDSQLSTNLSTEEMVNNCLTTSTSESLSANVSS
ncbi:hypothetical protein PV328_000201 [Microctonus aethiopoides]|uniref:DUF4211 domain-containing protein n=1 Tax=Microctonus aethiopoides TaxID=144406 RepID=A0AA39KW95_9HYME|nr:hypothetical protein PV328_000201 [Microctonus aethiopoides]